MVESLFHKLVIVHQGALGDFLLALPVFEGLYNANAQVRLDFWSKLTHVGLLANKPYMGKAHSCQGPELVPFFHDTLWKRASLPPFFEGTRALFVFGQEGSRLFVERVVKRADFPVYWIQSFPETGNEQPILQFLLRQFRQLGWPVQGAPASLEPLPEEESCVKQWLSRQQWYPRKPVIVHPGSGGIRKIWPLKRWWAVLQWLQQNRRVPVLLILGPADECLKEFAKQAKSALGIEVLEGLPLTRLAAFLAESRFYLGNDSGVTHLAAAMRTSTVAIFGPTSPRVWAPQGRHVYVIQSEWEEKEIFTWSPHLPTVSIETPLKKMLNLLC